MIFKSKEEATKILKSKYPNAYLQDNNDSFPIDHYLLGDVEYSKNIGLGKIYIWLKK